jgi:hypothetical protein
MGKVLDVATVASLLGDVSERYVRILIQRGEIEGQPIGGRPGRPATYVIPEESVQAYKEKYPEKRKPGPKTKKKG